MSQDLFTPKLKVAVNPFTLDLPSPAAESTVRTNGQPIQIMQGAEGPGTFRGARANGTVNAPTDSLVDYILARFEAEARATTWFQTGRMEIAVDAAVVAGQRPASRIEFYTNENNAAPISRMFIGRDGNVGISAGLFNTTERPSANLHILGEGAPDLHLHIEKAAGAGETPPLMEFFRSRGTVAARANVASGDLLGRMAAFGFSNTYFETAKQEFAVDGAVTAGQAPPSRIDFYSNASNAAAVRAYSLRANQNLHVGTEVAAIPLGTASIAQFDGHVFGSNGARHIWLVRSSSSNGANFLFARSRGDDLANPTNVVAEDRIARIEGYAFSGATGYWATARIDTNVDGAVVDNQRPGSRITFWTNPANGAAAERMRITGAGKVGIGVTPDADKLLHVEISQTATSFVLFENTANASNAHVVQITGGSNTTAGSDLISFFRPDGTLIGRVNQNAATTVQYLTSSDARLKENIIDAPAGLSLLRQIKVREYNYRGDNQKMVGFIAQELNPIYPDAVCVGAGEECNCGVGGKDAEGNDIEKHSADCCRRRPWGVDYGRVTPLLVKAVQELLGRVEILEGR